MGFFDAQGEPTVPVHSCVWFKLLGDDGVVIKDYRSNICFSAITGYPIPKDAKRVIFLREKTASPYNAAEIARWVCDLNEVGFPCTFVETELEYTFELVFSAYSYKAHMVATLMLLRALFETGFCTVPEYYFRHMDTNPKADKLDAIQTAHKKAKLGSYANRAHMITCANNGANVSYQTLLERWKKCGADVYHCATQGAYNSYIRPNYSDKWMG